MDSQSLYPKEKSLIDSICIGSGRFLRAVLAPALVAANLKPIIVQTRGTSFMKYCSSRKTDEDRLTYEVDTVLHNGEIKTDAIVCYGAGTLGTDEGKRDTLELLDDLQCIKLIGVGVTEAGLASASTKSMRDLFDILCRLQELMSGGKIICNNPNGKISIVNTDNVPHNGDTIRGHMMKLANGSEKGQLMLEFLKEGVVFHNSMVDRITSQRPGSDGLIPRAEPTPAKALVIEDLGGDLPLELLKKDIQDTHGVVIRMKQGELDADIALKLRIANGTHTALAHTMALCGLLMTDVLSCPKDSIHFDSANLLMTYLDALFEYQICTGVEVTEAFCATTFDAKYVYHDWRQRLVHGHFGLSTFFITQNGAAKGGIRIGPTIIDLVTHGKEISSSTIFALAAILRFLTPAVKVPCKNGIYRGWMDGTIRSSIKPDDFERSDLTKMYADGLSYNLEEGWYEFRCDCNVHVPGIFGKEERPLPEALGSFTTLHQPCYYYEVVKAYLIQKNGGDLSILADRPQTKESFESIVKAVSSVYARMVAGDGMLEILKNLILHQSCDGLIDGYHRRSLDDHQPLHYKQSFIPDDSNLMKASIGSDREAIKSVIFSEVASVETVDLHTHLLPPSHGALCLWGIDELLTYHYLVAEYFMTAPSDVSPESFYSLTKQEQANIIWKALFVNRTPVSEACRGVVTTLVALGLEKDLHVRDLDAIRKFFKNYRDDGIEGVERYCSMVFQKAGVRYAVMTNIPFDPTESQHWKPKPKKYSLYFRSACRVDPLLAGDKKTVENALAASGYDRTIEGARKYLHDWCDVMKPEYMMASTPHNFVLQEDSYVPQNKRKFVVNEDALNQPFAFTDLLSSGCDTECDGAEVELASVIDEDSDFLSEVLMKVCEERDLPIALKIGAHRNINPRLRQAGDGVVAFADTSMLARLCTRFPKVRFLATFLSRNNQHEACVLATKFRNLHIYGCWWFCNNPSIIEEITKMRIEMLGTAFTAQHSDSRVVDQLLYKWAHSRAVIANVMTKEYIKLSESGWTFTREELRRDVQKLFGKSYEEFMAKSLVT